jgi:hypothetical protein
LGQVKAALSGSRAIPPFPHFAIQTGGDARRLFSVVFLIEPDFFTTPLNSKKQVQSILEAAPGFTFRQFISFEEK